MYICIDTYASVYVNTVTAEDNRVLSSCHALQVCDRHLWLRAVEAPLAARITASLR